MRWVWLLVVLFLVPQALAITMNCPASAVQNENFDIEVSHPYADQVSLRYNSQWHPEDGETATWTISESYTGPFDYYGDAFIGDVWIGSGSDFCSVTITSPTPDSDGTVHFTAYPSSIEFGDEVSLSVNFYDDDGTDEIEFKRGSEVLQPTKSCSGGSCYFSLDDTPPSTGTIIYTATGYDINRNDYSKTKSVSVTGASVPSFTDWRASDYDIAVGESTQFTFTAEDAGGDLATLKVFFGDGQSATTTCSGGSCTATPSHSYTSSGSKNAYAVATDAEGHAATSTTVTITVSEPATDADADSVPDATDQCPSTPLWARPVVTASFDPYRGCACAEIINFDPDPTRDDNPCTDDTCGILRGFFRPQHFPVVDGTQPEGYVDGCSGSDWLDYACVGGAVTSTTTTADC